MWTVIIQLMRESKGTGQFSPPNVPRGLVLTPTRELAIQIQLEAQKFAYKLPLKTVVVYGGQPKYAQAQQIRRGCDITIATPGRLKDFLDDRTTTMQFVKVPCCTVIS